METIDERTFKEKAKDFTGRIKMKVEDGKGWVKENKDFLQMVAIAATPGILWIVKSRIDLKETEIKRKMQKDDMYFAETLLNFPKDVKDDMVKDFDKRVSAGEDPIKVVHSWKK